MPNRLQFLMLGVSLSAALAGSSCTKKDPEILPPAASANSKPLITGIVQPVDAVLGISLLDNATQQTFTRAAIDNQTGAYHFDALPAGIYILIVDKKPGYVRPRQLNVTVTAGKTIVVPTITVVKSTATFTANGVSFAPTFIDLSLGFDGKQHPPQNCFSIALGDATSPPIYTTTYALYLTMPFAVRVGSYSLNDVLTYAILTDARFGTFDSRLNPLTTPSSGKLIITAVENTTPFPRSVSGTFSFTGTDATTGIQRTVSGSFADAAF